MTRSRARSALALWKLWIVSAGMKANETGGGVVLVTNAQHELALDDVEEPSRP
jgi:hypothetical protein